MPLAHEHSTRRRVELPGFGLPLTTGPYLDSVGPLQPHLHSTEEYLPNALIGVSLATRHFVPSSEPR